MKASWNGRQVGASTDAGSFPCIAPKRRRAAVAITRLAMRKAFERRGIGEDVDPVLDAVGGGARPLEQRLGHLAAFGAQGGENLLLVRDPGPVLLHERPEGLPGGRAIGQRGEGLHPQLDVRDRGGSDALDLGGGNPARVDRAAGPRVVDLGMRGDAVADGVFVDVAVLQVGDPLVPVVGRLAPEVGPGDERLGRVDLQPGLEDEPLVPVLVEQPGVRWLTRKTETERVPGGTMPSAIPRALHRADGDGHAQAVAVRDLVLDGPGGLGGEIQGHLDAMGLCASSGAGIRAAQARRRPSPSPSIGPSRGSAR